ncbi:hypothetical protein NQ314_021309 [Rhamnusium bicolor]|uniref:Uncharacterized protein n=1 Tax=Rhamnusium bicolor TaxID=1586634 RepID=A0AAV8WIE7_9CUCU|nr:hypothetical protein NQ314_021309 [Rhamnusium bicolor]
MAQGKLKVKSKLPQNVKSKKQLRKGNAVTKRANCPIQSKKKQHEETQKIKQIISKTVNKAVEEEIRARAISNKKPLSIAQKAVADHHSKASTS